MSVNKEGSFRRVARSAAEYDGMASGFSDLGSHAQALEFLLQPCRAISEVHRMFGLGRDARKAQKIKQIVETGIGHKTQ